MMAAEIGFPAAMVTMCCVVVGAILLVLFGALILGLWEERQ